MLVIDAANVNEAWAASKIHLNQHGVKRPSRVSEMLEYPEPVTTKFRFPCERVLFDPTRDCNPFFHFFEGLWMLAGRNDVAWITQFNKHMMSFSDDGVTYHAAYGHRWRHHFDEIDQLAGIVSLLERNHDERRAVLQMWDPTCDLGRDGKDLPCNTAVYFKIRKEMLYMTVSNRSNDIVWGAYGANCVHMSMLQEYLAAMLGVGIGPYHQVSDSWHAYTEYWEQYGGLDGEIIPLDFYENSEVAPYPLVRDPVTFDRELQRWIERPGQHGVYFRNSVFHEVAVPMYHAWTLYKEKQYKDALHIAGYIQATDWRKACELWLERRAKKQEAKAA